MAKFFLLELHESYFKTTSNLNKADIRLICNVLGSVLQESGEDSDDPAKTPGEQHAAWFYSNAFVPNMDLTKHGFTERGFNRTWF